jgi:hypothetical protein
LISSHCFDHTSNKHKPFLAPEKFEFEVGPDSYKMLLSSENHPFKLLRVVNGELVDVPTMMMQPAKISVPQLDILVLDYEFDPQSIEEADPVAVYKVQITIGEQRPYIVNRRFKEIADLNDNICSAFNGNVLYANLPEFPLRLPKFLADHTDPAFLRDRCEAMNEYFTKLPLVPFVMENPDFQVRPCFLLFWYLLYVVLIICFVLQNFLLPDSK